MMDADLRLRYLHAMGVQVWRSKAEIAADPALAPAPAPEQEIPVELGVDAGPTADLLPSTAPADEQAEPIAGGHAAEGADWERLETLVAGCRTCGLCKTRTRTVFGVGNRQADLMLIGEAPGADEDREGEPFVGRAGQLLNLMLEAIGLRREDIYIANILKCRPPLNRDPEPQESASCRPFLMRQIELVQPRILLSVGRIAAQNLLSTDAEIGRLRGHWFKLGPDQRPLMVTYHPAYLLRSPEQKARVWRDLVEVARKMG